MKLSEILGWGDKKVCRSCSGTRIIKTVFGDECCPHCHLVYQWNEALTSCDREIDREALAKAIQGTYKKGVVNKWNVDWDWSVDIADHIISNMPTWLRKVK